MNLPWPAYLITAVVLALGTWHSSLLVFGILLSLAMIALVLSNRRHRLQFSSLGVIPIFFVAALAVLSLFLSLAVALLDANALLFASIPVIGLVAATAFFRSGEPEFPIWAGIAVLMGMHSVLLIFGNDLFVQLVASDHEGISTLSLSFLLVSVTMAYLAVSRLHQRDYLAFGSATAISLLYVAPTILYSTLVAVILFSFPLLFAYGLFRFCCFALSQITRTPRRKRIFLTTSICLVAFFLVFKAAGGSTKALLLSIPPVESAVAPIDDLFVDRPPPPDGVHCRVGMDY